MALEKDFRSPHSPSPIYGDGSLSMNPRSVGQGLLRPGFNVGDLDRSYEFSGISTSAPHNVYTGRSTSDLTGTTASPHARVVKIQLTINSGSGSVDLSLKSNSDGYTATIFDSGAVTGLGVHEFYVGGWSSPTSNSDASFQATQYGPVVAGVTPSAGNTTGDEETDPTKRNHAAESNYVGGTYNPVDFLSLAGDDIKFFATVVGTINFDVTVVPVS